MKKEKKLAVVMDPLPSINPKKDTTLAMMLEAQRRGWELFEVRMEELFFYREKSFSRYRKVEVFDDPESWFLILEEGESPLSHFDLVLMRKDPPFNTEYIYATYLLERAQEEGVVVLNNPSGLRDANEKMFTLWFPELIPPTLVTRDMSKLKEFLDQQGEIVVKPPDGMGGRSIFLLRRKDPNINVILETITRSGSRYILAQQYIPEARLGDKRIILIDGEPIPYALKRVPPRGDFRGNLAVGAKAEGAELTERDFEICEKLKPELQKRGLFFVGIDILGPYLSEINVTSPTGVREIDRMFGINICGELFDQIEKKYSL